MSATATLQRETHTYLDGDGKSVSLSVSAVLSLSGIVQPYPESAAAFVEHAGTLGTVVHEWAEYLDLNPLGGDESLAIECLEDSIPLPYVLAYQRFLQEHQPEWEHIEQSFTDPKLDCAGTPDRIGTIKRGKSRIPAIIDIKTAKQVAKYWPIQLSGYQLLANRLDCMLYVVHLAGDGSFKLRPYESDTLTFLAAVQVAQWRLRNGAKVR